MANCIIAQSGGPTAVINSSVVGLVEENNSKKYYDNIYAGINGIEGILNEKIINLSKCQNEDLCYFKLTPSSGLGSCRYKMKDYKTSDEEYKKFFSILEKLDIKAFFYIGGNDSMDTVWKLSSFARENNLDVKIVGIPKTIDNDLPLTDHTPGFGSAAKLIATITLETYLDSSVYTNNGIFILETMGRDTGWLAASACVAKLNGKPVADFIYLPEIAFDTDKFIADIERKFKEKRQVYIVASEGLKDKQGKFISTLDTNSCHDNFGHAQLGGVGNYLKNIIISSGITHRVKVLELNVIQRCAMHLCSKVDLEEAYAVGQAALNCSMEGDSGSMVAIKRDNTEVYSSSVFTVDTKDVANHIKYVPYDWINEEGNNVNEKAYEYILPLIQGNVDLFYDNSIPKFKVFNK